MTDPAFRLTTLDNGMRVVSETMPHVQTATFGVWVDVGTRHEAAEVNGVAHLLEHMAFKGTRRRTARGIAEEIEQVGGALNAYTSREHTAYYARVLAPDVPLAADIIADILQHSTVEEDELEKERHVVLQEIGQVQDTPDDLVFDLFQEAAYPDQPMGRSILGPEAIVAAMPRQALIDYMAQHYGPGQLVLAAAGKVEHGQLVDLARQLFADLPVRNGSVAPVARYRGSELVDHRGDLEQVHLCVGVEGVRHDDPDYWAQEVFSMAWGGGMSSRLFQEVREKRGLAYAVTSFASSYRDTGMLGVYAGTGAEQVVELLEVVTAETRSLIARPDPAEIARAKAQLKAGLLMSLESCPAVCSMLARQLLTLGRCYTPTELVALIDAVDVDAVQRLGRRLFKGDRVTTSAVGPLDRLPSGALTQLV